jgi:hypothetical protein
MFKPSRDEERSEIVEIVMKEWGIINMQLSQTIHDISSFGKKVPHPWSKGYQEISSVVG